MKGYRMTETEVRHIDAAEHVPDDELCAAALAADPDTPVADDAICLWALTGPGAQPLPEWYMPAPMGGSLHGWRRQLARVNIALIIMSFAINAYGLCNTYGQLHL